MKFLLPPALLLAPVLLCACDEAGPKAQAAAPSASRAAAIPESLFVAADIADPKPIPELKKGAKAGDTVVIRGHIGGKEHPFVDGAAVLSLVDATEPITCGPADPCPTKWDYCCAEPAALVRASATVKLADAAGNPVMASLKGVHGLSEFCLVTVRGKVLSVDEKNLVVAPEAIYNAGADGDGKKAGTPVREGK